MLKRSTGEHNGHTNFETWAFYTHITQTQSLLNQALEEARPLVEQDYHPAVVGDEVISYFKEWCWDQIEACRNQQHDALLMTQDVGSWWRIDDASIGRHMIAYIKEEA